jgi:exodeoxyribonuclease VII small subunit
MTETIQSGQATGVPAVDFEDTLAELEGIVEQLEGEVRLEEALALFERGMKLSHICERFLKTAEQKIEVLKRAANGSLETTPYNADNDG